jgi:hypothetical protein
VLVLAFLVTLSFLGTSAGQNKEALISDALSAAPAKVAKTAKVVDWDGTVLKEGSGAYTCYRTPAQTRKRGREPMCVDKTWTAWADAWANKKPFKASQVGIGYMLIGDAYVMWKGTPYVHIMVPLGKRPANKR